MTLRLIKGGTPPDLTEEVNLQFAKLMVQATYHNKKEELKELQDLVVEYDLEQKEHLILLELFKQYNYLLELKPAPFKFIQQFQKLTENTHRLEQSLNSPNNKHNNG